MAKRERSEWEFNKLILPQLDQGGTSEAGAAISVILEQSGYHTTYRFSELPRAPLNRRTCILITKEASWCASGVCKRPLRLKCMTIGRPIEKEGNKMSRRSRGDV
ncbi:hypothetical protein J6590_037705 [Homalodisca vitripennis]|nr:hypothetical protein J6590_037705 [Homalodisca vitripennis]